jgi:chromate reductase
MTPGGTAEDGTVRVLLVSGSTRSGSTNTAALRTTAASPVAGVTTDLFTALPDLPAFSHDDDHDPPVARWPVSGGASAGSSTAKPSPG